MSPELLNPDQFSFNDCRPTKESDCYALGMVIYEVLSGQAPFASFRDAIIVEKVTKGERPERPDGVEGAWFTDKIWGLLNRCWATQPEGRPSVETILEHLDWASRGRESPPPHSYTAPRTLRVTQSPIDRECCKTSP